MNWPFAAAFIAAAVAITWMIDRRIKADEEIGMAEILGKHDLAMAQLAMTDSLAVH